MISVIIPTRNRADLLSLALQSILLQTLPQDEYELIVVDNGSSDNTENIIDHYDNKIKNLKYLYVGAPGLHRGRHAGMDNAKGNILVFADDDIEAFPTWLESVKKAFDDEDVVMVGGNNIPFFLEKPPLWLLKMWNRKNIRGYKAIPSLSIMEYGDKQCDISPNLIWGCNFSIRKNVLLDAGGFHPDGMPKELLRFRGDGETHVTKYVEASGKKCCFHPGASVYHKVTPDRMTYEYFRQRGFSQGISDSYADLREKKEFKNNNISKSIKYYLRIMYHEILIRIDGHEVKFAYDQLRLGYNEGYAFHQKVYYEDSSVRDWVHILKYY